MDHRGDAGQGSEAADSGPKIIVPQYRMTLPDGRKSLVSGDVEGLRIFIRQQGYDPNFGGTCSHVACQSILNQFGIQKSEEGLLQYAIKNALFDWTSGKPDQLGMYPKHIAELLVHFGVSAQVQHCRSHTDLAGYVESGHGVIAAVNARVLRNDPMYLGDGRADHAVVVIGVTRPGGGGPPVRGFFINDPGTGTGGFVTRKTMREACINAGGLAVVTEEIIPRYRKTADPHQGSTDGDSHPGGGRR